MIAQFTSAKLNETHTIPTVLLFTCITLTWERTHPHFFQMKFLESRNVVNRFYVDEIWKHNINIKYARVKLNLQPFHHFYHFRSTYDKYNVKCIDEKWFREGIAINKTILYNIGQPRWAGFSVICAGTVQLAKPGRHRDDCIIILLRGAI